MIRLGLGERRNLDWLAAGTPRQTRLRGAAMQMLERWGWAMARDQSGVDELSGGSVNAAVWPSARIPRFWSPRLLLLDEPLGGSRIWKLRRGHMKIEAAILAGVLRQDPSSTSPHPDQFEFRWCFADQRRPLRGKRVHGPNFEHRALRRKVVLPPGPNARSSREFRGAKHGSSGRTDPKLTGANL